MKQLSLAALGLVALAACQDAPVPPSAPTAAPRAALAPTAALLDPELEAQMALALPTERLTALVTYDGTITSQATLADAALAAGAKVVTFTHFDVIALWATADQIRVVAAQPGVWRVEANREEPILLAESVKSIGADQAHATGVDGTGVGIAIIDSGVDGTNVDLPFPTKVVENVKFPLNLDRVFDEEDGLPYPSGRLALRGVPNTDNSSGHGTHVAGITGSTGKSTNDLYKGVAPGAHVLGFGTGEGASIIILPALAAFDFIIEHKARYNVQVVNNSWGGRGAYDTLSTVALASRAAHKAGITVVFAAGNDGPAANTMNRHSLFPWVISVAAGCKTIRPDPTNSRSRCVDASGRDSVLAGFSSRGVAGDPIQHPDITAPGVRIVSNRSSTGAFLNALDAISDATTCNIGIQNLDYYTCASGTSMAAPHVAGVVALLQHASGNSLTPDQVLGVLRKTARPLAGFAEWEVGAGYLDAAAAVSAVRKKK